MNTRIALAIYTKRKPDDEPRVILQRVGRHDWSLGCEPNPDAGRFRPSCVGRAIPGKSTGASLFFLAKERFHWDFAGPESSYVRLADADDGCPAVWGIVLPFSHVLRFATPISSATFELCTRADVESLLAVHPLRVDAHDWHVARAIERNERLAILKGFGVFDAVPA
jgi:hypothetical protein